MVEIIFYIKHKKSEDYEPKITITGAGVVGRTSSELSKTSEYKRQLEATKKLKIRNL